MEQGWRGAKTKKRGTGTGAEMLWEGLGLAAMVCPFLGLAPVKLGSEAYLGEMEPLSLLIHPASAECRQQVLFWHGCTSRGRGKIELGYRD